MKILHLISSPRGEASFSIKLGNAIVEKLQAANPDSTLITHDLTNTPFPHLEEVHINSFFTPLENHTAEFAEAIKHSNEAIAELKNADVIVIGAPLYNFGIPSTLKAWIDHIARAGQTFSYSENGPEGLVKNKKLYLAISSGGVYSEGPMKAYDFTESYLRSVLGFMGMVDVTAIRAEGLSMPNLKDVALDKAIESISI
ncbi:FMN-dependent NADH-azoreductase [Pedobacter sp. ISL-68]|uniref:FMN-dependent NADH-azoreductase n=1 Tax=unclassified Pedobacter TaxID=2628915 RepID=UPI001BE71D0E|nr:MULTISPECIES: FMN-dependent NADH-azoreductase [unclassified Pedobacter]MBT2562113.1 FMN-dependent NADH-azoreductase [Pedobacter sp. ISL-64]MBT2591700.1 FMN-dependent NADH-azoreductase [Pedobacter sp. ISL-68]